MEYLRDFYDIPSYFIYMISHAKQGKSFVRSTHYSSFSIYMRYLFVKPLSVSPKFSGRGWHLVLCFWRFFLIDSRNRSDKHGDFSL